MGDFETQKIRTLQKNLNILAKRLTDTVVRLLIESFNS